MLKSTMTPIEVFRTDILAEHEARRLNAVIQEKFPHYQVNFDLTDCDKVMRVRCPKGHIDVDTLKELATDVDVTISPLPDIPV